MRYVKAIGFGLVFVGGLYSSACAPGDSFTPAKTNTPSNLKPTILTSAAFRSQFPEVNSVVKAAFVPPTGAAVTCDPEPTQDQINTSALQIQDYYLSSKRALSLGISVVNGNVASDFLVIVRDYRRFKACTASDGSELQYGQVIRAVIELTSYDASTSLGLASLAASATLSGKQQYFHLYKTGWFNPKADSVIATVSGKVFDVENYALYQGIMPQLINMLSGAGTTLSPQIILRIPKEDDANFVLASARAYAFSQAKDGKSCVDASKKFSKDTQRAAAIAEAYAMLKYPGCSNSQVVEPAKSQAKAYLGGLSVK